MQIAVDVDGVVADFVGKYLYEVRKISGHIFTHADLINWDLGRVLGLPTHTIDAIDREVDGVGWCNDLEMLDGAENGINMLQEQGHDLVFATSPMISSPTWCYDRMQWCERNFPGIPVVLTRDKRHVRADLLIDDSNWHVDQWASEGRDTILMAQPWNHCSSFARVMRVNDWAHAIKLIGMSSDTEIKLP